MRKQIIETAVYDVATQVRSVEDCIDAALAEIADLQSRMVHATSVAGLAIGTSHEPFEKLVGATCALVSARGSMVGCHAALVEAQKWIPGIRTTSFGDVVPCPPKTGSADLHAVA
jgi:hypothetical protein